MLEAPPSAPVSRAPRCCLSGCPLRLFVLEGGAGGRTARVQILVSDEACAGAIELGQQRTARIPRNGSN